ncbi:cadherin domain-containing protein [Nitrogeniibacter aestuarii]|uniref:cadherin domain-containing protein n=1 Tax=Nitrogeniibacter aestuarii TaxID=2815343 RepID=UPI001D12415B|nr:cadherin domain-containing protein [Nitrogeniibacter aestuarii]
MARPLPALSFEALEARILYSADLAPVTDATVVKAQEDEQTHAANELVFIDASLQDVDSLVASLQEDIDQGRQLEIIFLDPDRDGVDQISDALAGRTDITAVHVITHGQAGVIELGSTRLDGDSVLARSEDIAAWSSALTRDADLLFYGCEVAGTDTGEALVRDLAFLTGADVAASDDLTGDALLGGDWQLEYRTGQIETTTLYSFGPIVWNGTLGSVSFQEGTAGYTGTQDTYLDDSSPNSSFGSTTTILIDSGATEQQGLVRFDNIFGSDAGKIPVGATITGVTLKIYVVGTDPADKVNVHRMTTAWNETTTWNNLGGIDVGVDTLSGYDYQIDAGTSGTVSMSSAALIATVQAWANDPNSNYGWAFMSIQADNYAFNSSENATVGTRPILEVTYTDPVAPSLDLDGDNSSGATDGDYFGAWTDGGGPVAIADADATIVDSDSSNLASLTVTISNAIDGTNEVLAADTTGTSIVASYDANLNKLTLSGTDSVANYQQVLRTITYDNLAGTPDTTARTINFVANDGAGDSNTAVATLSMTGANSAPDGTDKTIVIAEDDTYTFSLADFGFSDVDGDNLLRVWIDTLPDQGFLLWNGATFAAGNWVDAGDIDAGQLSYRPPPDANGTPLATFTFRVQDDGGTVGGGIDTDAVANTITLQVNAVNDAPLVALDATNLVSNGSFESGATGWTGNGGVEAVTGKEAEFMVSAAPDGSYLVEVEGSVTSPDPSYIEQTITTEVGKTYVLSLWAVTRNQHNVQDMGMLSVNGVELDRFTTSSTWHEYAVSFTATSTSSTIRITSLGSDLDSTYAASGDSVGLLVDDVRVVAANNAASYTENGAAVVLSPTASLFDLEHQSSDDFSGATLSLARNSSPSPDDLFGATGTLSALTEGAALVVNGTTIGTVTTNSGGVLTLTFSAGATTALVDEMASQITYANSSDGPPSSLQVDWTLTDSDGGSDTAYTTVSIATSNDAPVVGFSGSSANFYEGDPALYDTEFIVTDADSTNFDGGVLTLTVASGGGAGDVLSLRNVGTGAGQIGISGSNVTYGGIVIGTWSGNGDGSTPVTVTFNASAGVAAVQATARALTFQNTIDDPAAGVRQLSMTLTDGDGGTSTPTTIDINVIPVNDAPTISSNGGGASAAVNVTENQSAVTTVTATDPEAADVLTYTLAGGADQSLFSINSSTGVLTFNSAPNYESPADADTNNVYEVTVQVSDGNGGTDTQAISVTVTNVNETPTLVSLSNSTVAENTDTSAGYSVGSLSTTDPDAGDSFTYTIVGGADQAVFSIGGAGSNELILTDGTLDFETQSSYSVIVRSTDAGGLTRDETFTVTVTDLNEAPGFTSSPVTGATEDAAYSYSITTTDPDSGASLTITATTLPSWLTLTDNGDGTATLSGTPTNSEVGNHNVVLQVSDGSLTDSQSYTVTVSNTNDAPTITSGATTNAAENQTGATTVTASDVDVGDTLSYSIIGGADQALFSINSSTGVLTFNSAPNYESPSDADTNNVYEVTVQVSDGNGGTDTQAISVTVTNVNETPTLVSLSNSTVAENTDTSAGYSVGSLNTTDPDAGDSFTYTVVGGADQAVFSIGGPSANELILTDGTLDFETQSSYQVIVRTTDAGGLTRDETFTVTVTDLNEAPGFTSSPVTGATEDAAYSYSITTTDPDSGASLTITATTLPGWLTLTDNGDGTATLSGTPTNSEVGNHNVVLQVSDGSLTDTQSYTITVSNTNDVPTITSGATANAAENQTGATTVTASDVDVGDTLSYSIIGGADQALFSINSSTGVLTFQSAPDFEAPADADTNNVYEVTVQVSDGNGGTDTQAISVTVTNVNETPTLVSLSNSTVAENTDTSAGYSVGSLNTTDPDAGDSFTYAIVGGADQAVFSIGGAGSNELILTDGTLDFETQSSYSVIVRSTDAGGLTRDETFTITVTDLNEAPSFSSSPVVSSTQDAAYSYTVTTTDPDSGATLTISAPTLPAWLSFTDNGDGTATLSGTPTNSDLGNHAVSLVVSDGSLSDTQNFTIVVDNVNDAPTITSGATANAVENQSGATTVTASDPDAGDTLTYSITGGADQSLFSINSSTGVLTFNSAPNYESPADADTNNVYEVTVQVSDGNGGTDTQAISVTITNVNETPTLVSLSNSTVVENTDTSAGYSVGSLNTTDPDAGDSFTYIVVGGADQAVFSIGGPGANELILTDGTLDFETQSSYQVIVRSTDAGGLTRDETFTVTVSDLNEAPSFTSSPVTGATEEVTYSHTLTASDPDAGASLSYSATTLPDWLSLTDHGDGTATLSGTPQNEDVGIHDVVVVVSDGSLTDTQSFAITVANTNDAPQIVSVTGPVNGSFTAGLIGWTATGDVDSNAGEARFGQLGGAPGVLSQSFSTQVGQTYYVAFDFGDRSLTESQSIRVQVDGSGALFDAEYVSGVADNTMQTYVFKFVADSTSTTLSFTDTSSTHAGVRGYLDNVVLAKTSAPDGYAMAAENQTAVTTISALDEDLGDTVGYSIVGGADQALFSINSSTGVLTFNSAPNYESPADADTNNVYEVTVQVSDGNGGTDTQAISVTVTNVNETPTLVSLSNSTVAENTDTSAGYSVGSLNTTDPDAGDSFTYTIVGGADQAVFSIGGPGANELILTDGTLDFETQSSYSVIVRSTDAGGLTRDETFTVTVTDLNEAPSFTSSPVTAGTEDAAYSYSITTTDPDSGASLTITATTLPGWLTLTDNGDGTATLSGTPTNSEVGDHNVVLQVSDGSLTDSQSYTVTVVNTNDAPTITGGATANAAENQTGATTVTASDVDVGDTLTYSIIGGADQGLFAINGSTGVLTFNSAPNYESPADGDTNNVYEVTVQVSDGNGGTDTQAISVTVTNVNETPTLVGLSNSTVAENTDTSGGYSVGSVSTTDPDAGDSFTYTIVGGADQAVFSIGGAGSNELILTDGTLDFETQSSYSVIVRSTDAGGLTRDETFTVTVTDLNEAPSFTSSPVTGATEDAAYSYSITTTDPDSGASLTITATTLPGWLTFTDNGDGTATLSGTPTNSEVGNHNVVLQVSDGSLADSQSYTITVSNTNDAPVITSNGGGDAAIVRIGDPSQSITTVTATDADAGDVLSFEILGGADARLFVLDPSSGALRFTGGASIQPGSDANGDNVFDVVVAVRDTVGNTDTQTLSIRLEVVVAPEPPVAPPTAVPPPVAPPTVTVPESLEDAASDQADDDKSAREGGDAAESSDGGVAESMTPRGGGLAEEQAIRVEVSAPRPVLRIDVAEVNLPDQSVPQYDVRLLNVPVAPLMTPAGVLSLPDQQVTLAPEVQAQIEASGEDARLSLVEVGVSGSVLTVGVIWWATRVGSLVGAMVATVPAWRSIDPMPIVRDTKESVAAAEDDDEPAAETGQGEKTPETDL